MEKKTKKLKPVRQALEELKQIRRRPVPLEEIEEFNRIVEKDDQYEEQQKQKKRRIARSPEADV
ncbi:MAG: hypothetical protein KF681_14880 [Bdellovibrionaceae bacterium]|nr:hypothetical protein [Pseudobdellovibrionaceae bacterium]